jgi:hypothetical protein
MHRLTGLAGTLATVGITGMIDWVGDPDSDEDETSTFGWNDPTCYDPDEEDDDD